MWERLFTLSSFILILIIACENAYYEGPENQPVFFEYHYINFAWGVADHGWMIDQEGNIRGYEHPENYRWPDSTGYLRADDLLYNLAQTDTVLETISYKEFKRYTRLISGAAEGALSDYTRRGADMGSSILS
jgi:hypothetical protein